MSFRALMIGLIGAMLIGTLGYINNQVLELERVAAGHLIPITVFGSLFVVVIFINPLLGGIRRSWPLRPGELAVVIALMLVGCSVPERGLMEQFTPTMVVPIKQNQDYPGWAEDHILDYANPDMFAAGGRNIPAVVQDFLRGRQSSSGAIGLSDVPWKYWCRPLTLWLPLVAMMAVMMTCLALIVHRQWAYRERLRYPIAEFASCLIAGASGGPGGQTPAPYETQSGRARSRGVFRNKLFWIGLAVPFAIHLVNGIYRWHPGFIQVPLGFDFWGIAGKWQTLGQARWSWLLLHPYIYPMVIGLSYFIASDVSLSLGLSQFIAVGAAMVLALYGVDMSESYMTGGGFAFARFGGYVAFSLILLYAGRRFYGAVLKAALTFRRTSDVLPYEAWACRMLIVAAVATVAAMTSLGLDWTFAMVTVLCMLMAFVVVSRISVETGLFFIKPAWQALGVLMGLLGTAALGPKAIVMVGMFCVILAIDPSQSLMAYLTNGLRMCGRFNVKPSRVGWSAIGTYVLVVAAAVVVVLWANYNYGVSGQAGWSSSRAPSMPFRAAKPVIDQLKSSRTLDASLEMTWWQRWSAMKPTSQFLGFAGAGFALVLVGSMLRLRFARWPVHPVLFLVWYTWPMATLHHSFLLGWLVKTVVMRFGGGQMYQKLKPMMIGVIAGDLLGGLLFMAVGAVYYFATGLAPIRYSILPV